MSWKHTEVVRAIQVRGGPSTKFVLWYLADRACEYCGLTWPGAKAIAEGTQLGVTRVREALSELVSDGFIVASGYATGGRARATEYVIVPKQLPLQSAPCARCIDIRNTHRPVEGLKKKAPRGGGYSENPPRGGGFRGGDEGNTHRNRRENPPQGGAQPSVNHEPSARARARGGAPATPPPPDILQPHDPSPTRERPIARDPLPNHHESEAAAESTAKAEKAARVAEALRSLGITDKPKPTTP